MKPKVIIAILLGAIFLIFILALIFNDNPAFSIVGSSDEIEIPYSCQMPIDCEAAIISDGAGTQSDINTFKQDYDIVCRSNQCVGVPK